MLRLKLLIVALLLATCTFSVHGKRNRVDVYQSDFDQGTYRITQPGVYRIMEHITIEPRPDNDYWNDPADPNYPLIHYYMGFFAGITIECDDVTIDLNGHTISMGKEFYLLQRFFNVIQLNDKIFVENEGVSPLNYQKGDYQRYPAAGVESTETGDIFVKNIVIKDGVIGLSSHAGIHGNGATNVVIDNVHVKDFEVAGIQCNGCVNLVIDRCIVGPASTIVPTISPFSSARFMDLFVNRLIPAGWAHEGEFSEDLLAILNETITFNGRSPVTIQHVFDKLSRAINLFRDHYMNRLPEYLSPEDQELLEEAKNVFTNPSGVTDGGTNYGILISHFGIPHPDENHEGPGTETRDITIKRTEVTGLQARPIDVPAIQSFSGTFFQGPARDLIRIKDIVKSFRTLKDTTYAGNFLSDVYFAMWQASNSFYKIRIYDSECGNYGSNDTSPYPVGNQRICLDGTFKDPVNIKGRDSSLYQKRYFGGLAMSQDFYDWATTDGATLESLLLDKQVSSENKVRKHNLVCGLDTMFHAMQGVIGIKIFEAKDVTVDRVTVSNLINHADQSVWLCNQKWKTYETGEVVMAKQEQGLPSLGADVIGIQVVVSDNVEFSRVDVRNLFSDEGDVHGIQIKGDTNDRTSYSEGDGISFDRSSVSDLTAGQRTIPFSSVGAQVPQKGLSIGEPKKFENDLKEPKAILTYGWNQIRVPDSPIGPIVTFYTGDSYELCLNTSSLNTEKKFKDFKVKLFRFFEEYFGLKFSADVADLGIRELPTLLNGDGTPNDAYIDFFGVDNRGLYQPVHFCKNGECQVLSENAVVNDFTWFIQAVSGFVAHGTYGGDSGKFIGPGTSLLGGIYDVEGIDIPGYPEGNIMIEFFSICPFIQAHRQAGENKQNASSSVILSCALESEALGHGMSVGNADYYYVPETEDDEAHWIINGYHVMTFDDDVDPIPTDLVVGNRGQEMEYAPQKEMIITVLADGVVPKWNKFVHPFGASYHWVSEAGVKHFQQFTSIKTDEEIVAFRKEFLYRLKNEFGIALDPEAFDDVPLNGVVDLGGGNHVFAYVVNEIANFRSVVKQIGYESADLLPPASRIREGGFMFRAGRAGRETAFGHIPIGAVIQEGIYIFENLEGPGTEEEMRFHSTYPVIPNDWGVSSVRNAVYSPRYGKGILSVGIGAPDFDGVYERANIRGTLFFD